ncbi:hypothetical protein [Chitinimonas lacunae]|uniref:Holin n=1 Tax=Chitinimonas lacunae TaxID=1963018 RepID=A0ABV8MLX5_9NEIS
MQKHEIAAEAARAVPPVSVAGISLAGVALADWVLIATLAYTLVQLGFVAHKWHVFRRKQRAPQQGSADDE